MLDDEPIQMQRIDVRFCIDIDMTSLNEAKAAMEQLRPATVEYAVAFDRMKARYTHYLGRLEGECQAYMNIARTQLKELHGI